MKDKSRSIAVVAMENMLLLATDMGLGSLWCGIFPIESRMQQMRDILNMPKTLLTCHEFVSPVMSYYYQTEKTFGNNRYDNRIL